MVDKIIDLIEDIIVLKVVIYDFVCLMDGVEEVFILVFVDELIKNLK